MQMQAAVEGALVGALRVGGGTTDQRIERALRVLMEQLGLQVAFVSEFRDGLRVVTHSVRVPDGPEMPAGTTHPVEDTLCHLVASGELPAVVGDAGAHPVLAGHPHTVAFGVAAYAGVPLRVGGQVRGAVCCAGPALADSLNPRDEVTLRAVAAYIGEVLDGGDAPDGPGLRRLAEAVAAGHDLQALTRPLLQLLQEVTGLESTYLTLVDPASDELILAYTHNTGKLHIPEGLTVSWQDALCRRAIDENRYYVADVSAVWPDAHVALDLGIAAYASVPVRDARDEILGTLCGASSTGTVIDERELAIMATFAQLIAAQLARETAHSVAATRATILERRLGALRDSAERDALTGLANRAGIHRWLQAAGERIAGDGARLAVAFVDLDKFKAVNDTFGHGTGDEVLRRVAASLVRTGRAGDLHGRLGGDEFIVAAVLPPDATVHEWTQRVRRAAVAQLDVVRVVASVGVVTYEPGTAFSVDEILDHADKAMYAVKHGTVDARTASTA
ncbi:diguanylate cyclase [Actinoplanes sp. NPDC049118]|uniref:sensor domain-containing diguanylate cyclase n=1 Tax=Actinoplanes sp. NPDC049118 TaxID=3155769 RepID=UPI0033C2BB7A